MSIRVRLRAAAAALIPFLSVGVSVADVRLGSLDDPDRPQWMEAEAARPPYPRDEDLLEFYVSATTTNRFLIDASSLSVGPDGVVRYVLVVRTAGGTTNVSFEGIRCEAREVRLYATGRADRTWAPARPGDWKPIENKAINRHHAALARDYFCPVGSAITSADEGRDALRRGKHPSAP